jgi:uncharacterized membrane protein
MRVSGVERLWAFLGYLPLLGVIIGWKVKRDSIFVQFHARQGAVMFGLWFVAFLVLIFALIPLGTMPWVGPTLMVLMFVISVLYFLLVLIGMIKVLLGERWRIPVVADVALMLKL